MELSKSVPKSGLQSELPKTVPKSGLQSDDPPSKLGLESVSPLSKIEHERLRSASKNGLESVDSPSKDGLESFKSLPKSDPVPHGDSTHTITPEMHVTLLIHDRRGAYRTNCFIKVDRDATIFELTRNFFRTNKLYLSTSVNAGTNLQATSKNYDEDLYIVDPQAHFDMLRQLERNVLQRSEFFQTKREYSLSSALDPVDDDTRQKNAPSSAAFWHLLKSYSIVLKACRSLNQMVNLRFCKNAINILAFHECPDVIEIRRVPSVLITDVETGLEAALSLVLGTDLEDRSFALTLTNVAMAPCRRLLERVGSYVFPAPAPRTLSELATAVRVVALVIDVGLVSYVRSHGSGFDGSYFSQDLSKLEVNLGDKLSFGCYWAELACLHSFLDYKKFWVFDFLGTYPDNFSRQRKFRRPYSVCGRIEDIADIWGPVYTVPTGTGNVDYYGVSKGIIHRVNSKKESSIPGAKLCHYSSQSLSNKKGSTLLANMDELALSQDDLLLIGAGFCENANCKYTMSAFTEESTFAMTELGTKDSVWKWDSRVLAVGLSKNLGVTVSGTQKLIPQTTLKQHILDSWTTVPSRRNPAVLNQYLGVEISHCTGNARRISLKTLMISEPIRPVLERQVPDWHRKPWGEALNKALHSPDKKDIVNVWNEHESNRSDIADLVCCVLQVLNYTGWNEQKGFNSAVLIDNEEWAVPVPSNLNSWLVALKDTRLTSAYVITNEICFGCEVPDRTISTCNTSHAFTALKTQIITAESPSDSNAEYLLKPFALGNTEVDRTMMEARAQMNPTPNPKKPPISTSDFNVHVREGPKDPCL
ncbi:MAG: hypothetical protein LQ339_004935 [Xanthoria mediterranea]|nr:MAG: hypothetical protein LQ339_004935 [Xanthoria mediterranea]